MIDPDDLLHATAVTVGDHLDEIAALFKPGARISVVVWVPGRPTVDFVLTSPEATIDDVIEVYTRRRDDPATVRGRTSMPAGAVSACSHEFQSYFRATGGRYDKCRLCEAERPLPENPSIPYVRPARTVERAKHCRRAGGQCACLPNYCDMQPREAQRDVEDPVVPSIRACRRAGPALPSDTPCDCDHPNRCAIVEAYTTEGDEG